MKRCKGPPRVAHHLWIHQLPVIFGGPPSLTAQWRYLSRLAPSMDDVRMLCVHVYTWAWSAWAHHCLEHVVRAHPATHATSCIAQSMWYSWAEGAHTCQQGCIKHGTGASQGADLTLLNPLQTPSPPFPLTLLVMLQICWLTWERCPILQTSSAEKSPGKFLWRTPSAEASGSSRQILEFPGGYGWERGGIPDRGFFPFSGQGCGSSHTCHIPLVGKMQGCGQGCHQVWLPPYQETS